MGIDSRSGRRAVFLDRDGVINRAVVREGKPYPPQQPADVELLPGVLESLARLHDAGFRLVVVTNQPDIARGRQQRATVDAIHDRLASVLPIDAFRVCPHDDGDGCECRKPKAGLLTSAAREEGIDLASSFMIGDRWRDVEAGRRAGCTTLFIDCGYAEDRPLAPDFVAGSLPEAVNWILSRCATNEHERS